MKANTSRVRPNSPGLGLVEPNECEIDVNRSMESVMPHGLVEVNGQTRKVMA